MNNIQSKENKDNFEFNKDIKENNALNNDIIESEEIQKKEEINQLNKESGEQNNIKTQLLNDSQYLNQKIELLTKNKLEKENEIISLYKINNELNISLKKITKENEILNKKLKDNELILTNLKIKAIREESEFNNLKKQNIDLSNNLNSIKQKNLQLLSEIAKKDEMLEKLEKEQKLIENKYQKNKLLISNTVNDYEEMLQENKDYEVQIKKYEEIIKNENKKYKTLEGEIEKYKNKTNEYEKEIMKLKSELLVVKKNNAFIASDKQELINSNDKLKNELLNLNIKYNQTNYSKNNIEEENIIMKNEKIHGQNYLLFLKNSNSYLVNDNKKLKQNLEMFIAENKQCAIVINDLKHEIDLLNKEIGSLIYDKKVLISKIETNKKTYEINYINEKQEKNKRYIKELNNQIINLQLQIEFLQNKVKELNGNLNIKNKENGNKMNNNKDINKFRYIYEEDININNNLYDGKTKVNNNNMQLNSFNGDLRNQIEDLNNNVKQIKENINRIDSNSFFKKTYDILRESDNNYN